MSEQIIGAEMHRSLDITDAEVRRRLAACYFLLLDLAKKNRSGASDDDCEPQPGAPSNQTEPDRHESGDTRAGSDASGTLDND